MEAWGDQNPIVLDFSCLFSVAVFPPYLQR